MSDSVDFIATVHPYDRLKSEDLARVAGTFTPRHYPAGTGIYQVGDRLPGLYLIRTGRVRVTPLLDQAQATTPA